jgi:DNA modification methylase
VKTVMAINDRKRTTLDGKTWLRYSISIWDHIKTAEERSYRHPAMFPQSLIEQLIEIFGHENDGYILDPFSGSGSTLCAAYHRGLPSIGFEISKEYIDLTKRRLANIQGQSEYYPQLIMRSCQHLKDYLEPESVGLCITSPPYWNILNRKRTADGKSIRNYGSDPEDIGCIEDYAAFLTSLKKIFAGVYEVLITGSYCIVIVMDIRKKSEFYPFHMDITTKLREVGFILDDIIIWDRRQEYNNLRPLGYPNVFRVNKVHEFILIFQKR